MNLLQNADQLDTALMKVGAMMVAVGERSIEDDGLSEDALLLLVTTIADNLVEGLAGLRDLMLDIAAERMNTQPGSE